MRQTMTEMASDDWDYITDEMLEEHIYNLSHGLDVSPISMMKCSARTNCIPDFTNFILPEFALPRGAREQERSMGTRGKSSMGRGRAAALRERARKVREKEVAAGITPDRLGDNLSGTGSEDCESYSSLSSSFTSSLPQSPPKSEDISLRQTDPTTSNFATEDSQSENGQFDDVDSDDDKNLVTSKENKKSKKIKFVKLDLSEPYVEYQSELLYGIPAGAEISAQGSGFMFSDQLPTLTDFKGYVPDVIQKQPNTQSVLDFPCLPKEPKSKIVYNNVNLNQAPLKENSFRAIASLVTSTEKSSVTDYSSDSMDGYDKDKCPVVVLENIPGLIKKETIKDLVQEYGVVTKIRTEQMGDGYTAYVRYVQELIKETPTPPNQFMAPGIKESMEDEETAAWVAETLNESDALLTGGEGTPLCAYVTSS